MAFHFMNGLNVRRLLLILEVLVFLIGSCYYDYDHNSFTREYTYASAKYQNQGKANTAILGLQTISALPPPKNFKRKFLHSVMKYTMNGVSAFNPLILELEIFKASDVKVARTYLYACGLCLDFRFSE